MAKRVFFSFHYQDVVDFRANVVRNHWVTKDRESAGFYDASIWEEAQKNGDIALKRLINGSLENTSATCVLIGTNTFERRWVRYEILKSIARGNHVFGVHVNGIKGKDGLTKAPGPDPFDYLAASVSSDGYGISLLEQENGKWIAYKDLDGWRESKPMLEKFRGKSWRLSALGLKSYSWVAEDGYNNFASWVG